MRVSDDDVRRALTWARNYGEIASYEALPERGRKWLIRLPDVPITVQGGERRWLSNDVPVELVLTSREALAFGWGCAVAGARQEPRREFAAREWGW